MSLPISPSWHRIEAIYRTRLARTFHARAIFPDDLADLVQEFLLRVLIRSRRYQPHRSSWPTFVELQFRSVVTDTLRRQRALKRGYGRTVDLDDRHAVEHPWQIIDFTIDLAETVRRLPGDRRRLVCELQSDTVAGVARRRGVSRDWVRAEIRQLRRALERFKNSSFMV